MEILMTGSDVAAFMKDEMIKEVEKLKSKGVHPKLSIIRVGKREDDISYERGAKKRMELIGIDCEVTELPQDISQQEFEKEFKKINDDDKIHGILLFRPLPKHLDEEAIISSINPYKDSDCMSRDNIAKVFSGDKTGHAPCTAEAVMEMLDYYKIDPKGKKITLVGRSMVVGKPLSMLLLNRHATVTICHTRTEDLAGTCRNANIVIAAAGKAKMITEDMISDGTIVIDVGINFDENGNMCGDVDFEAVKNKASYITPVPKGVGSVTTSILAKHVIKGAKLLNNITE